ncbi:MAG TPA: YebC/PmpR family DNA-binding transcriptional regulator [Candidatus Paceibacterota bacterium]|jgi:YebC/PmpR family DNA-binding regulatory protein|nr:YebC/PmpR family DNA-binding transcriptional regulator [Parcubacteria group bacterium]MDP6119540.1 YebC/PmpR family DNA-binding transcriptional regulator [Candidatus Paceibacterota bacterium]HJN62862.1 YebC/PmpR family DNA-binding transcriptional regulator [Candidatus Paceibacterota bacterium]|tara:strand:+ start:322 stop:852 length:531 start_codon:yes stop_codon:yes gene_type:complete
MSGHNKWSKIKHKKAAGDARKSKVFSKLVQLIQVESKKAGGDINSTGLKLAIEKAKKENMPKENIERAVKKGTSGGSVNLENVTYESYGPGGVAVIIETLTDNKNRTGAEVKNILTKNNLVLSTPGSALWAYERRDGRWDPKIFVDVNEEDKEKIKKLTEALEDQDDVQDIYTNTK